MNPPEYDPADQTGEEAGPDPRHASAADGEGGEVSSEDGVGAGSAADSESGEGDSAKAGQPSADGDGAVRIAEDPEGLRIERDQARDRHLRLAADFDNYRKRAQRDQAAMIARSSERVLASLLPVLDSLDAAAATDAGASSEESLRQGLTGTRDQLLSTLAREGLEPIEALGEVFDPNLHEAAHMGEGSGTMVVEAEWRRGYTLNGRVVRATLVAVGYEAGEDQAEG